MIILFLALAALYDSFFCYSDYYQNLMSNYGENQARSSVIEKFDSISVRRVAIANKKLYVNKKDGFIGLSLYPYHFCSNLCKARTVFPRARKFRMWC